jgi:hypothetical protein
MPGPGGAHNWHPMSFNPVTGLIYLPTNQGSSFPYSIEQGFVHKPGTWNIGVTLGTMAGVPVRPESEYAGGTGPQTRSPGALVAWDPVAREFAFETMLQSCADKQAVSKDIMHTRNNSVFTFVKIEIVKSSDIL